MGKTTSAPTRFYAKIAVAPTQIGCWLWTAHTNPDGYGMFSVDSRDRSAHRWSYEYHVGPIPEGLQLDHLCRVRSCVNPAHLEPVTQQENIKRGIVGAATRARNLSKTHCPQGHPYAGANLIIRHEGFRVCRTCKRIRDAEYRSSKQMARAI